jgi:hypothetical protein
MNPDDFSSKWMITLASTRRTHGKNHQPVAYFTLEDSTSEYCLVGAAVSNEVHMKPLPSRRPACLPLADRRLIPVLFGRHHRRDCPHFHEPASK